ncbi:MAG: ECF-type sigma factor [Gemmatimonadaceae bacterium]
MTPARDRLDAAFVAAYDELRRLASHMQRQDPGVTFDPTGLVNETWIKLSGSPDVANTSPLHFKRIAARAMRQVLVEAARRRQSHKRGGATKVVITLDDSVVDPSSVATDVLALDSALAALGALHPRPAAVVEARFFGGLTTEEIAQSLEISEATVLRDWRTARAWLAAELSLAS